MAAEGLAHGPAGTAASARMGRDEWFALLRARPVLALGVLAIAVPTLVRVAQLSWSTEQGAHGPIVLATGVWLILRSREQVMAVARPGSSMLMWAMLVPLLLIFWLARVTSIVEVEGFAMYASLIVVAYGMIGAQSLKVIWFPLFYLLFIFPPPDTLFAMITQPLKIWISWAVVTLLYAVGYPIAGSGVSIQIGQYQLLVAAACAGVYSIISLSAVSLFYVYFRHNSNWRYMMVLLVAILPVAVLANLVRAMLLVLVTYHFGDAAGQGFFHEFAGLTMFVVALLGIFLLDVLLTPLRDRLARKGSDT